MTLTIDQRENLINRVQASGLREDAKERVLTLLSKEDITEEDAGKVLSAIQSDIEEDFAEVPAVQEALASDKGYKDLVAKNEAELAEVERTVKDSAVFIEAQSSDLDGIDVDIAKAENDSKLDEIKGNLGIG